MSSSTAVIDFKIASSRVITRKSFMCTAINNQFSIFHPKVQFIRAFTDRLQAAIVKARKSSDGGALVSTISSSFLRH